MSKDQRHQEKACYRPNRAERRKTFFILFLTFGCTVSVVGSA